jgi:CheY-like chemotaxis protein
MEKKVLIIEDDVILMRFYNKLLTAEGYEVEMADDGREGIRKIKSTKPSLILLDIMLPEMNGIEVLEIIKANPETKDIPVVVLTNLAGRNDAEYALEKGADRYLIKSKNEPKKVLSVIKEAISS